MIDILGKFRNRLEPMTRRERPPLHNDKNNNNNNNSGNMPVLYYKVGFASWRTCYGLTMIPTETILKEIEAIEKDLDQVVAMAEYAQRRLKKLKDNVEY